ncbi:SafA/ExsA family spore coat assembly protein [bacterium]|nr:SafA/ExsA family spore coat assembly protein [bacterium]
MKKIFLLLFVVIFVTAVSVGVGCTAYAKGDKGNFVSEESSETAAATVYTVVSGDSLWKIAVKYEVGLKEIITANPQIANPALIYVGQKINIPSAAPLKSIEDEVVRLINVERSKNGLQTLTSNWQAARVARIKSQDMINSNYFSHTSPTYGSPFKMLESYGLRFSAAAENIAYGQRTAQEVVNSWMNSPGHRANILSKSFTQTGVGVAKKANGTLYFTQMFLKPI